MQTRVQILIEVLNMAYFFFFEDMTPMEYLTKYCIIRLVVVYFQSVKIYN